MTTYAAIDTVPAGPLTLKRMSNGTIAFTDRNGVLRESSATFVHELFDTIKAGGSGVTQTTTRADF